MSKVHDHIGTLAEKLELSNALRKQAERELSKERVEHGKTKAYVNELEARIQELLTRAPNVQMPKMTEQERAIVRKDEVVKSLLNENRKARTAHDMMMRQRDRALAEVAALKASR